MVDDKKQEPTQRTPKGYEIPIPKRKTVLRNLEKIAGKRSRRRSHKK